MKKISVIPAKAQAELCGIPQQAKLRVCAYCRVSTGTDQQMASYEAQVSFYTQYIKDNPQWEFAGIYADKAVSGTDRQQRTEFNHMIKDCQNGSIDLIITKSISRFARNTADCLDAVRLLKNLGVAVYFEKENINTMSADSELMLSVLSSFAQDESRNISENVRWSVQKRFKDGKLLVNARRFLGYDIDRDGNLVINPEEAKVVRRIFDEYLAGKSMGKIARGLEADGIKTVTGLERWGESTVRCILSNEKYCGDAMLQKTYTVDYLSHKKRMNRGQVPMFYVRDDHPPIVSRREFEQVQNIIAQRAAVHGNVPGQRDKYLQRYAFSGKIICGSCQATFKRRIWNCGTKSSHVVWQCSTYIKKGKAACAMKAVDDMALRAAFVQAFNRLYENRGNILEPFMQNIKKVLIGGSDDGRVKQLDVQINEVVQQMKALIRLNINGAISDDSFSEQYASLSSRLDKLREERNSLGWDATLRQEALKRTKEIDSFLKARDGLLSSFDEDVFNDLVVRIVVMTPECVRFEFKNDLVLEEALVKEKA